MALDGCNVIRQPGGHVLFYGCLLVRVLATATQSLIIVWNGERTKRGSQSGSGLVFPFAEGDAHLSLTMPIPSGTSWKW